ncbi:triose-phosphate isomerase [Thermosulfurimonas marina]|uniref:Triosephosphate isomerase n=1 Tax=Thermosulfurimonas marina TaxID=2047767 RepID=A0A6H1WPY9_9BACT|nr:triose-phosphate isomerase [Thermosulfurimonas marina]QJA05287.1 triose-phosphate isomerase [Thermosulfurimonas marina]
MRRPLIAGNWKMHKTVRETLDYIRRFRDLVSGVTDREIMIAPPFTALYAAGEALAGSSIRLGAQNAHWAEAGAFTGEISPVMLKECGVTYVIIGHSERRHIFGETDEMICKRLSGVMGAGLRPILCIGETLEEREAGKTFEVLERQVKAALQGFAAEDLRELVVAYEPVWAIGTGKTATPEQAQEAQAYVRRLLADFGGKEFAEGIRILYGGSVKPENISALMAQPDVDGALVGGASLDPETFARIVKYA